VFTGYTGEASVEHSLFNQFVDVPQAVIEVVALLQIAVCAANRDGGDQVPGTCGWFGISNGTESQALIT